MLQIQKSLKIAVNLTMKNIRILGNDKEKIMPLVSVIVPSYNHENFITQCVESIVNQTYKNIELIVIDDGSKDKSQNILKELQKKYNFQLIIQENIGLPCTLNRGICEFAKGKYISFCASDDFWLLDKIENQVKFMEDNQFYPMSYGRTYYVAEDSTIIETGNDSTLKGGWIFDSILLFDLHPPVNYMYRRSIFEEVGIFSEDAFAEDYDMNLKISNKYCIGFIDKYLSFYRLTDFDNKINRFNKVANSHLISIEKYKSYRLYSKAKTMVYLRKFDNFSAYKRFKIKSSINLIKSLSLFYKKRFIFALIKLLFFWK